MNALYAFPKPVAVAVAAAAIGIGGGATMLRHCDLVYSGESARFQCPFVSMAICPEFGSSVLLIQRCGYQRAAQSVAAVRTCQRAREKEMGLVNEVVPDANLYGHALAKSSA